MKFVNIKLILSIAYMKSSQNKNALTIIFFLNLKKSTIQLSFSFKVAPCSS